MWERLRILRRCQVGQYAVAAPTPNGSAATTTGWRLSARLGSRSAALVRTDLYLRIRLSGDPPKIYENRLISQDLAVLRPLE